MCPFPQRSTTQEQQQRIQNTTTPKGQHNGEPNTTVNVLCLYVVNTTQRQYNKISQHNGSGNFTLPLCCDVVLSLF